MGSTWGCGAPSRSEQLQNWEHAVAEAAGSASGERAAKKDVRLPRRRERMLEVSELRVGLTDFFSLQGCRWGELVGERNSPLGRVMPRTRRLVYEIEFLEAADSCLGGLSPERRSRFEEAVATKRGELGLHVWNAVWAGPEMERFLSATPNPFAGAQPAAAAAAELQAALAAEFESPADGQALEAALHELERAVGAGSLIRDLALARDTLDSVSDHLERAAADRCDAGSRRLVRLFEGRYVPVVQPILAQLDRDARPVLDSLAAVYELTSSSLPEPVPALDLYYERVLGSSGDALGPGFRAASLRHARAWAPVLAACGWAPSAASAD